MHNFDESYIEIGYGLSEVRMKCIVSIICFVVAIGYYSVNEPEIPFGVTMIVLILAVFWQIMMSASQVYKVHITTTDITVKYLLSFGRGGRFDHSDIKSYGEFILKIGLNKNTLGGVLSPGKGKSMFLMKSGSVKFDQLHEALLELYPGRESEVEGIEET